MSDDTYRCEHCGATFEHPIPIAGDDCPTVEGHCAHLMNAGWRPVWVHVSTDAPTGQQNRHIFSRGGWICSACAEQFKFKKRRRYRRRGNLELEP